MIAAKSTVWSAKPTDGGRCLKRLGARQLSADTEDAEKREHIMVERHRLWGAQNGAKNNCTRICIDHEAGLCSEHAGVRLDLESITKPKFAVHDVEGLTKGPAVVVCARSQ
jgi:hypothetical protein